MTGGLDEMGAEGQEIHRQHVYGPSVPRKRTVSMYLMGVLRQTNPPTILTHKSRIETFISRRLLIKVVKVSLREGEERQREKGGTKPDVLWVFGLCHPFTHHPLSYHFCRKGLIWTGSR